MLRILRTAESGVSANSQLTDYVAQNLANMNTVGYKHKSTFIQELACAFFSQKASAGAGAALMGTTRDFSQGVLISTGNNTDLAISGEGFFQLKKPDGTKVYTRSGVFNLDAEGHLVNTQGYLLDPEVTLEKGSKEILIREDGKILATNEQGRSVAGEIFLCRFSRPDRLKEVSNNFFEATEASGEPVLSLPGENGCGNLLSGILELANVEMVKEMTEIILAQRAFQFNAGMIRNADEMWGLANKIRP